MTNPQNLEQKAPQPELNKPVSVPNAEVSEPIVKPQVDVSKDINQQQVEPQNTLGQNANQNVSQPALNISKAKPPAQAEVQVLEDSTGALNATSVENLIQPKGDKA